MSYLSRDDIEKIAEHIICQYKMTYLSSLLPLLSGLEFLQHKRRVLSEIEMWQDRIKKEEIDELLESLG